MITRKNLALTILFSVISAAGLAGCGLMHSPQAPTPQKVSLRIDLLESGTVIHAVDLVPMDIPNPSQSKIVNTAAFRITQDIRSIPANLLVLPQNALITGVYSNDGKTCQISWQEVYYDYRSLELNQSILSIGSRTANTPCDPKMGIRPGQAVEITLKN